MGSIIARKEAKLKGYTYYFTGKPCKYGHISYRNVTTSNCHECWREGNKRKRTDNPGEFRQKKKEEYRRNRKQILEQQKSYRQSNWKLILERRRNSPTHKQYMQKYFKQYFKRPEARARHHSRIRKRQLALMYAIPEWFEKEKVQDLYVESSKRTQETGIEHHVDHIIPLQGDTVCGLHCYDNLQIISATENRSKSNKLLF